MFPENSSHKATKKQNPTQLVGLTGNVKPRFNEASLF